MNFNDYKISEFIEDLGSNSPSPGGGSTAALVMALGGALNNMVYSLTIGKKSFEKLSREKQEEMISFREETQKFIENSMELMEEDRSAFNKLMAAYKIPKEQENRGEEIDKFTVGAMYAPLKLARLGIEFYKNIWFSINYGNKMLLSDGGVAAMLLNSSIEAAILNVKVNLQYIENLELKKKVHEEIVEIGRISTLEKNKIMDFIDENIKYSLK